MGNYFTSDAQHSQKNAPDTTSKYKLDAIAWAIAVGLASIAWAVSAYLMIREKQRAQVTLARLEIEAKKLL